ncbi:hypothetical protein [Burkholderia cepacia]|uniref:hypothetical protein n=1 Tax=Burkholderia cepacia TaxID=292 RepID=UPI000A8EB2F1|nr:hypothetical protein [Burkholderia cepacia]
MKTMKPEKKMLPAQRLALPRHIRLPAFAASAALLRLCRPVAAAGAASARTIRAMGSASEPAPESIGRATGIERRSQWVHP